ncbi:hypothetical protein DPMN_172175 [Dreissena polymorpha]|uniref:Uncharacterized protein n=1 Tax=Dreissena polymorpha TaxID=45954 RepID=A0A9D4E134_DREPO|nr:hypothetical protein DPMN_172175 [Dreissena polymorpha]
MAIHQLKATKSVVECSGNHGDDQSRHVFKLLDYVGYSHDIIAERRRVFHGIDAMINNARVDKIVQVTAGSKAEGFASCFESDYDYLSIYQNIVCKFEIFTNMFSNDTTEFCMLGEECHLGKYTLKLLTRGVNLPKIIKASLVTNHNGEIVIASDLFTKEFERTISFDSAGGWNKGTRTGPSVPSTRGIYRRDDVYGFRCVVQKEV